MGKFDGQKTFEQVMALCNGTEYGWDGSLDIGGKQDSYLWELEPGTKMFYPVLHIKAEKKLTMTQAIFYGGKQYPAITMSLPEWSDEIPYEQFTISVDSLSAVLLNKDNEPVDAEASDIDDTVFFYVPDEYAYMSADLIQKYVTEQLCGSNDNAKPNYIRPAVVLIIRGGVLQATYASEQMDITLIDHDFNDGRGGIELQNDVIIKSHPELQTIIDQSLKIILK